MQRENPDLVRMWVDMQPLLEKLSLRMTSMEEWVRQHGPAFTAVPA